MPGLSNALNISQRSLQFSQTALNTVSHNISNVNTAGFYRQEVQAANQSIGGFGNGVVLSGITRTLDPLLLNRLTEQRSETAFDAAVAQFEKNIESVFGSPTTGSSVDEITANFFSQASALTNTPESSAQRLNMIEAANFLTDSVKSINQQLVDVQGLVDTEIDSRLVKINTAIQKIAQLNQEIVSFEGNSLGGRNAADLRDERQRQVDILAENFNITTLEDDRGNLRVSVETGQLLVSSSYVQLERTAATPPSNFGGIGARTVLSDGSPSPTVIEINTNRFSDAGEIKALIQVRDETVPDIAAQVNEFTQTLIDEINLVHSKGVGTPPLNNMTSANGHKMSAIGADLITDLNLTPGSTFDLSLVDTTTGTPLFTTVGSAAQVTIGASPYTMTDLANDINTASAAQLGGNLVATVTLDTNGNEVLNLDSSALPNSGIVWGNDANNVMGKIGINNFFRGTDANDISVRQEILDEPLNIATARMRADGGLSFNNNENIAELAGMIEGTFSFDAAGSLSSQNNNMQGYFGTIVSNLAVRLQDNTERANFSDAILSDLYDRHTGITGVNLDEELNKLLIYQQSYQASARMISAIDELFDAILQVV